jgi:hypothetical protein
VEIPIEIAPSGVLEIEIFFTLGRGWRENLPRGNFGVGIEEEASVPADSLNPSLLNFLFFIFENYKYQFCYAL